MIQCKKIILLSAVRGAVAGGLATRLSVHILARKLLRCSTRSRDCLNRPHFTLDPTTRLVGEFTPASQHRHLLLREDAMSPITTSSVCSLIGISPLIIGCSAAAPAPQPKPRTALFSPSSYAVRECRRLGVAGIQNYPMSGAFDLTFSLSQNRSACRAFRPGVATRTDNAAVRFSCNAAQDLETARLGRTTLPFG
jgi:hypothetical protein